MDGLPPFHQTNTLFLRKPQTQNPKLRCHSLSCPALGDTAPCTATPAYALQLSPSSVPAVVGGFSGVNSLASVKMIHAQMIKMPGKWSFDDHLVKILIRHYVNFGDHRSAALALLLGLARSNVGWNSFSEELKDFRELPVQILEVFDDLRCKGMVFDARIFTVALRVCTCVLDLWLGVVIHAFVIKTSLDSDAHLQRALMNFYERCWGIERANQVFNEMPKREDVVWNEAVKLNMKQGQWIRALELFRDMQYSCMKVKCTTTVRVLQACGKLKALAQGKQIHAHVLRFGMESSVPICNVLISMYAKNGELERAGAVFNSMEDHNLTSWNSIIYAFASFGFLNDAWSHFHKLESSTIEPDIITWNCLLSGHTLNGSYEDVLTILRTMQTSGIQPNSSSITCGLQSVIELGLLPHGKEIHGYVMRHDLHYDVYVGTSIVDMYVKSDCLDIARAVFNNLKSKNIFAWNSLISGYSFKGHLQDAENLVGQMEEAGIKADIVTWNSMVSGYSMWGHTEKALDMIHQIKLSGLTPNVISWTALISGCSQNGKYRESLEFFIRMQEEGIEPNAATISTILRICGGLSLLQKGKEIHCLSVKIGVTRDVYVATAIIDMYNKSGNWRSAHKVFKRIHKNSLASYNCMIMGFAIYGLGKEAISLFHAMCSNGITPDAITFTAILSACNNSGLVDEGWEFFDKMSGDYNLTPKVEHYSCMVDLLGRAGYLDETWDFIQSMPLKPDATIWGALLCSSRIHENIEYAEIAAENLFELEPDKSANYVLMMNLYAMSNRWKDVAHVKELMNSAGVKHTQAWSWIQIDRTVHHFSAEQSTHPDCGEIYFELYQLISQIKKLGYVPDVSCVYQNIDDVEKEKVLLSHTEKLAITYGLMKRKGSAPIRVIKSSRICSDCHTVAKYISMLQNCEIVIKDGVRFHHLSKGNCSCKDCW
ncbi:pentatricopeptide repeat-containing protein At4g01030, mitochondrial [Syzygium oleosum]|uniref:pentatricopeptide repeat-containing protein At4g01030, mitochondrial n=1 Tax=Syzygium oleosum TaxID=219896 RepID=UPI0024BA879A|nr:pentatricopeptide repeat-containing protein At4g01030, mitochondrial [Syzygium oleosum]